MLLAVALVLAQAGASPWAGARPPECASVEGGQAFNVWERAKTPRLRRYCDVLASGAAKLASSAAAANEALTLADEAKDLRPEQAAPLVLEGRALLQLGRYEDGRKALEAAKARDPHALDDALALLAWARSLAFTNRAAEALGAYRELLPRAASLPSSERTATFVEAGLYALVRGPAGVDDAVTFFRRAVKDGADGHTPYAALLLALALDRSGARDEAKAILAERSGDARRVAADATARPAVPALGPELAAAVALAQEAHDRVAARAAWKKYADAQPADGPWVAHARAHESEGKR